MGKEPDTASNMILHQSECSTFYWRRRSYRCSSTAHLGSRWQYKVALLTAAFLNWLKRWWVSWWC